MARELWIDRWAARKTPVQGGPEPGCHRKRKKGEPGSRGSISRLPATSNRIRYLVTCWPETGGTQGSGYYIAQPKLDPVQVFWAVTHYLWIL
jgi:hypothetical protein